MSNILDNLAHRVLVCDGAMGSLLHSMNLDVEKDYLGKENCNEVLNLSRPDVIRKAHTLYFEAGVDMVETNTFCASTISLEEFGLADKTFEINKNAAEIAREAAEQFSDGRKRFVIGSVGPGTKLPSLGHITYDELEASYITQCQGLISGGVDAILVETTQDTLQIKSAVNAAKITAHELNADIMLMVQVTVETTGSMLVGSDLAAATTVVHSLDTHSMGMNCAMGPQEMAGHVKWLSENWEKFISIQPNAGMPEMLDGQTHFPLKPAELAYWHEKFITEYGINIAGGCCGTNPEHLKAVDAMLKRVSADKYRPTPVKRKAYWIPSTASLYSQVPYEQENSFFSIGERCNANGSKKFREILAAEDWDSAVELGKEQAKAGSNSLDVCVAVVGRDEVSDMKEVVSRMRGVINAPLVFDSTEVPVLETALKLYGGKGIINSINFEDGEEAASKRLKLAKKFGAGVIALTIDEKGMAKTTEEKLKIARRLYDFACNKHGLPPSDLIFDPLTFTICTGSEDDKRLGINTLDAIEQISKEMPECQVALGLSNVSFGLRPAARHILNSVFLDEAIKRGMTSAIVHLVKIKPMHKIPEEELKTALDLIYDRGNDDYNPLHKFISLFENRTAKDVLNKKQPETVEERLKQCIIDGSKKGLEENIDEALKKYKPVEIINGLLLEGMKTVGEYFGSGKMQLPFVLQAAESMKAAVDFLEPYMEANEKTSAKGKMVLATVRGDVHDIGKNLVDIILSTNGYKVHNIGIKGS